MSSPRTELPSRVAWMVVIVATLTMTVSYVDRSTLSVLAPSVTKALELTESDYGWLTAAFSFAYLVGTPLAGWWIDRIGARAGLVSSLLVWSTVAALHSVVPGMWSLFGLRIALGLSEGPGMPGTAQTIQRVLPAQVRARAFGMMITGSSIGGMLAPPLASRLYGAFGWRVAFLGTAAVGLAWIPVWIAVTRRLDVRARIDVAPDRTAPRPSLRALVSHPMMIRGLFGAFAAAPLMGFVTQWGAKYLVRTFHVDQKDVGHYLWLPPLLTDAGALLFGDLASRQLRRDGAPPRLLWTVAIAPCVALALLPAADSPWQSIVVCGAAVFGAGAMYTMTITDTLSRMPAGSVAFAGGILACGQSVAYVVTSPLIGAAVDRAGDYDGVAIVLGAWVIPCSLVWLLWKPAATPRPA